MVTMSNLPNWPGAAVVYRHVQMINIERAKRAGKCPDDITDDIIPAMNRGDEEILKAYQAQHKDIWL